MNLQPLLSQTRFVRDAGISCPVCHSSAIECEYPVPIHGMSSRMETTCSDCHARWFVNVRVTGYRLIDPGSAVTAQVRRQRCRKKHRRTHAFVTLAA
jgi:C4-type Zn-finger protein